MTRNEKIEIALKLSWEARREAFRVCDEACKAAQEEYERVVREAVDDMTNMCDGCTGQADYDFCMSHCGKGASA